MPDRVPDIPWSDLKLVLEIQRAGTLRAATDALGMSHPTLSRRIAELQDSLGVQLFERDGRRLKLTEAGEDLAQTAARIEPEVDGLGRRIAGRDHRLQGVVTVALSPSGFAALTPAVAAFRKRHPGIDLEFVTGLSLVNLTRREADVAVRFTHAPPETLVGRKVSQFQQAAYVHRSLQRRLRRKGKGAPFNWPWVDWDASHRHHSSARWIAEHVPGDRVTARCDSSMTMFQLVKAAVGVGFVPTMLAHGDPDLVPAEAPVQLPVFNRDIWVLTHADLRRTGRVRAVVQWLGEVLHVDGGGVWLGCST